jgi:hypothetical protein
MAGLAHFGLGFAAKRLAPKVPVVVLLLAAIGIDLLWAVFFLTGIERMGYVPWSHGLFMAGVWSIAAAVIAMLISRDKRVSILIGLLFFSHWVLDFISHPLYFTGDPKPDLPLFFDGSPKVGLGLYSTMAGAIITDIGVFILGLALYITYIVKLKSEKKGIQ